MSLSNNNYINSNKIAVANTSGGAATSRVANTSGGIAYATEGTFMNLHQNHSSQTIGVETADAKNYFGQVN